jgi:predicted N-acetyltransferase YhbS
MRRAGKAAEHALALSPPQAAFARVRLTRPAQSPKRQRRRLGTALAHKLTAERPEHAAAIERVLDRAFGPGRYAKTSERVREQGAHLEPTLSRVALDDLGEVAGVCRIWRVKASVELFFLGPLAVDPDAQAAGLGLALVRDAVAACRASGGAGIVLVGAERFFRPAGFSVVPKGRVSLPGPVDPARLLWLELKPGGLDKAQGQLSAPR